MGLLDTIKSLLGLSSSDDRRAGDGDVRIEHEPTRGRDDGAAAETDAAASTETLVDEGADADEAAEPAEADAPTEPLVDPEAGGAVESAVTIDEAEPDRETDEGVDEPVATETDATASTESLVDEDVDAPEEAAEPPEAHSPTEPSVDPEAGGAVESDVTIDDTESEPAPETGGDDTDTDAVENDTDTDAVENDTDTADTDADDTEPVETVRGIGPAYADRLADVGVETVGDLAAADAADLADRIEVAESRVGRWVERARERTDA